MSKQEQFYYNITEDSYTASGIIIHINPKSYWDKKKNMADSYTDIQYNDLYPMLQNVSITELKECVYEPVDPTLSIDDLEWIFESAGFISCDEFDNYIED